jgi:hypothetical protein
MTIKLGTRSVVAGFNCEVTSVHRDGKFTMRRVKGGKVPRYSMGEKVRITRGNRFVPGEITSLSPLQATVTEGAAKGWVVGSSRIRKQAKG